MTKKLVSFLYRERYLMGGMVVVPLTTFFTGFFTLSVIGYICGIIVTKAVELVVR